ncbi:MAG: hypothetical protein AB1626_04355 [Candidatus Micrarchaeota archaeon]
MKQLFPFLVAAAIVAVLALIVALPSLLSQDSTPVTNFQECAAAGNPVMESYPAQCRTPDGRTFVQEIPPGDRWKVIPPPESCRNYCGDGVCQEVVCMAVGCPCAETPSSCPQDCAQEFTVQNQCGADEDCLLVNKERGFSCCWAGACEEIDYSQEKWVAANRQWFESQRTANCPSTEECGPAPMCAVRAVNEDFEATCMRGACVKTPQ